MKANYSNNRAHRRSDSHIKYWKYAGKRCLCNGFKFSKWELRWVLVYAICLPSFSPHWGIRVIVQIKRNIIIRLKSETFKLSYCVCRWLGSRKHSLYLHTCKDNTLHIFQLRSTKIRVSINGRELFNRTVYQSQEA